MIEELLRQMRVKIQKRIKEEHKEIYDIEIEPLGGYQYYFHIHINGHIHQSFWMNVNPKDSHWMKVYYV